jgi:predicted RNA binding protein YcfA (HicA-like mRNA interferase family)
VRTKKARDIQKRLEWEGWIWRRRRGSGSHRIFDHPVRSGKITLPWHHNGQTAVTRGVFAVIVKTAGWK